MAGGSGAGNETTNSYNECGKPVHMYSNTKPVHMYSNTKPVHMYSSTKDNVILFVFRQCMHG